MSKSDGVAANRIDLNDDPDTIAKVSVVFALKEHCRKRQGRVREEKRR